MIVSIASGKGGTGKTTVATGLALSVDSGVQLLDCDVEEPNAHIFIKPETKTRVPVFTPVPEIDKNKCDFCGRCQEVCAYNAIAVLQKDVLVFKELCHGCGSCSYLCPRGAISEINREIGFLEIGNRGNLQFAYGKLNIGEAMSPPLIRAVKKCVDKNKNVVIDVPPGTSCPAIEAVKGSDFCILVTEPTPFGLHDLSLAVQVLEKLTIPFGVVINRFGVGDGRVDDYCRRENIPVLMRIPFEREIAVAYSKGIPIVEALPEYKVRFGELFAYAESPSRSI